MPNSLIVKTFRKDYLLLGALTFVVINILAIAGAYLLGQSGPRAALLAAQEKQLETALIIKAQRDELDAKAFELAALKLGESVSELAVADLQTVVVQQQDRIVRLESEAIYYRNLMTATAGDREVFVHRVQLQPDQQQRTLGYQIMLTHADPDGKQTLGRIALKVAGRFDAREETLDALEAGLIEPGALDYDFRYFQNFSGELKLPEGFRPVTLELEITSLAGQTLEHQVIDVPMWEV